MSVFKKYIVIVLLTILAIFIAFWIVQLFNYTFSSDREFIFNGIDAFLGAFLAFLFIRIGDFLTKIYDREVKHYNALVFLNTELNSIMGITTSNLFILPNFKSSITKGNIYWGQMNTLPITKELLHQLYDIELINDVFRYINHVETLNDDINNITGGYKDLKNALIDRKIKTEHYITNAELISKNLTLIEAFLKGHLDETIKLTAKLRLAQERDKPLASRLLERIIGVKKKKFTKKELLDEEKQVRKEISEVSAEGNKRISTTLKKHGINKLT
jgi:hypothetical protein